MNRRSICITLCVILFGFSIFGNKITNFADSVYMEIDVDVDEFEYNGKNHKIDVAVYIDTNDYKKLYNVDEKSISLDELTELKKDEYKLKYPKKIKKVGKYKVYVVLPNGYKKAVTIKVLPKMTKIKDKSSTYDSITLKWKKISKQATGYQVKYSKKSNMSKSKTITINDKNTCSTTINDLSSKTNYYVSIRTYKKVSGKKYYSEWTDPKRIKTTKAPNELDYSSASALEKALNKGVNCEGKTAKIKIQKLQPNSIWGYNLWAGKHLNFVSSSHPGVGKGDTIKVEIVSVDSFLGSWIITYKMI